MVSPGEFIPVFEKNGFIIKLDYYVWDQVCQLIATALRAGRKPDPISVNVSRVNLYNPNFLESLVNLVEKYRIPPEYLHLELTESVFPIRKCNLKCGELSAQGRIYNSDG